MDIVPYVKRADGQWSIDNHTLVAIWETLYDRNVLKQTFPSGQIKDVGDWVTHLRTELPVFLFHDGVPIYYSWLSDIKHGAAQFHFCPINPRFLRACGLLSFAHFLSIPNAEGLPMFDVLWGAIASNNWQAIRYAKILGCTLVGEIPHMIDDVYAGQRVGAVLFYVER